jgi:hypothetical protein
MRMSSWSAEERAEYKAILLAACESAKTTRERGEAFLKSYNRALSAGRMWARDIWRDAEVQMAEAEVVNFLKSHRVAVAYNGKLISKPRIIGSLRTQDDGTRASEQALFDFFSWEELEAKAQEYVKSLAAHRGNLYIVTRLLKLRDLAPGSSNASEAAAELGTTVEAWLAS